MVRPSPVFALFGSNVGDRRANISRALAELKQNGLRVARVSGIWETKPAAAMKQRNFFNAAAKMETTLSPSKTLALFKRVEKNLGRKKAKRWGPRSIDIDILFFGGRIINTPGLTVPHPELHKRDFALAPLAEIAPRKKHPVFKKTVSGMLAAASAVEKTLVRRMDFREAR